MEHSLIKDRTIWQAGALALVLGVGLVAGCKHQPARTDQQVASDVQAKRIMPLNNSLDD